MADGSALCSPIPRLETERLRMVGLEPRHFTPLAQMYADPKTMRYIGDGTTLDRTSAWRSFAILVGHWHLRGYGIWAVEDRSSGELIGRVGFFYPEGWPGIELGWMIRRDQWKKGYATEAAQAALAYQKEHWGFEGLISLIRPDNEPSIRVAEKLSAKLESMMQLQGSPALLYRYW